MNHCDDFSRYVVHLLGVLHVVDQMDEDETHDQHYDFCLGWRFRCD
jgi:hypothetical protein